MEKRPLGRSGLKVSALSLGTMNWGSDWHGTGQVDEKAARDILAEAREAGVNLIDTADIYGYGAAETLLGRMLKKDRGDWLVATKVRAHMRPGDPASGGLSARHIAEGLDASLKRLGTDHVDLYMPHYGDPEVPLEESLEAFAKAHKQGKVRALGCSNFPPAEWRAALSWAGKKKPRFEFNQVQLSLAFPYPQADHAGLCAEAGTSLLAWSPLGGGFLSGKYRSAARPAGRRQDPEKAFPVLPEARLAGLVELLGKVAALEGLSMAQAALGWVIGKPGVASAVVGARTPEQLREALKARPLSARSQALLDRASVLVAS
ncbi:MAG: aldo/keto reductase [Elusimicrobia bacterium]|nr:aldo/keto reductase [Elusimicrobiota bacterium]